MQSSIFTLTSLIDFMFHTSSFLIQGRRNESLFAVSVLTRHQIGGSLTDSLVWSSLNIGASFPEWRNVSEGDALAVSFLGYSKIELLCCSMRRG